MAHTKQTARKQKARTDKQKKIYVAYKRAEKWWSDKYGKRWYALEPSFREEVFRHAGLPLPPPKPYFIINTNLAGTDHPHLHDKNQYKKANVLKETTPIPVRSPSERSPSERSKSKTPSRSRSRSSSFDKSPSPLVGSPHDRNNPRSSLPTNPKNPVGATTNKGGSEGWWLGGSESPSVGLDGDDGGVERGGSHRSSSRSKTPIRRRQPSKSPSASGSTNRTRAQRCAKDMAGTMWRGSGKDRKRLKQDRMTKPGEAARQLKIRRDIRKLNVLLKEQRAKLYSGAGD